MPHDEPVSLPDPPGTVVLSFRGMCSTDFNEWYFTPEGDRISRDTTPTYWHHTVLDRPEHRSELQRMLARLVKRRPDHGSESDGAP